MSRFVRTGIASLNRRTGPAGLIVAVLALVIALAGGAYAASGALTSKQKKEVRKIAKQVAGQPGANGTNGSNGAQGPAGPQGPAGADGAGVTSKTLNPGNPKCPQGGSEFTSASGKTYACAGKEGKSGFAAELPAGQTSTGAWTTDMGAEGQILFFAAISFPYPVSESGYPVHFIPIGGTPPATCPGSAAEPAAEAGNVCVYQSGGFGPTYENEINPEDGEEFEGAGKMGTILKFSGGEFERGYGTWAVTSE